MWLVLEVGMIQLQCQISTQELLSKIGFQAIYFHSIKSHFLSTCEPHTIHHHVSGSRGRLVQYL